jgi:xylulokinase
MGIPEFRGVVIYPADRRPSNTVVPLAASIMSSPSKLALGLDLSTQQLKIVAVDITNLETFYEKSLTFETDLAHYKTTKGVYNNEGGHEVYSPVEMWIEAVDVMLETMKADHFPFENVIVVSGAGQVGAFN